MKNKRIICTCWQQSLVFKEGEKSSALLKEPVVQPLAAYRYLLPTGNNHRQCPKHTAASNLKNTTGMKTRSHLKGFRFKSYEKAVADDDGEHCFGNIELPPLDVTIDFENGKMDLRAGWQFISQFRQQAEDGLLPPHEKGVQMEIDISVPDAIDLNTCTEEGLLLPLEGCVVGEATIYRCTRMIILEYKWEAACKQKLWHLAFYIYSEEFTDCEIVFRLPLFDTHDCQWN